MKTAYYARDLGMATNDIISLMYRISNYWHYPLSEDRLQKTIISQINR